MIDKEYIFTTTSEAKFQELKVSPLLIFREDEGITIITEKREAEINSLNYSETWSMITLAVHSNLSVVGFIAIITDKLAKCGISVNVISAFHHDHLFVPTTKANKALQLLDEFKKYSDEELEKLSSKYKY